ncbi:glutamate-1-semialdehyde 2,1-aminomutase [Nocardioides lentus]|uniref:Glutamate-1-semialdehyde 2,1-aminomutase n=1 Tax=Nocardioides lentus TaxID=338077 RepID=A0ABP5ASU6_9ACTN
MTASFARSTALQERLHRVVPGGAHTYARGSDQYPEDMAPVLVRGEGARVLDADGRWLVEYGMGLRSVTLGHGYAPVADAVAAAARAGVSFSRPSVTELEAAERLVAQVPGAEMVKFTKNGSDATTAAVRLARAVTGRDLVAVCTDQPFFSTDDWFIGTTPMSAGIGDAERARTVGFRYNDLGSLEALLTEHAGRVACVVMEAATALAEPEPGFLEGVRALTARDGCVWVLDEMITGMRWAAGGAQQVYGVTPDLSTWGKALGNGFAVSALAGRRELMELGGLRTDAARTFLLSTTHGPEVSGLAAYLAVADAYDGGFGADVVATMERRGAALAAGVNALAASAGLADHVVALGRPSCLVFATRDHTGAPSQAFRTLFLQGLLTHGVLGQSFVVSAAHTEDDLAVTLAAVEATLPSYARALEQGSTDGLLRGRPVAPALRATADPRRLPDLDGA